MVCELALELVDHGATDESSRRERGAEDADQCLFEILVGCHHVDEWYLPGGAQSKISFPRSLRDRSAASSMRTTRAPATPSLTGVLSFVTQSMKYPSSTVSASARSIRG